MSDQLETRLKRFMRELKSNNPYETEFQSAVEDVARSVMPLCMDVERYRAEAVLERLTEPDRIIVFRVTWEDDEGRLHVNRGWRVQFSNALGPYKGGLRFHPDVNQSVLKFLGFEQIFKNALTGLPMGGGKGGANFDSKGRSEREIMRFCHSFMSGLHRYIGPDTDVPAGDIGVGAREIGYLFGQHLRLQNEWSGVLTGKQPAFGGSAVRTEATGYGCVYFLEEALAHAGSELKGKRVAISGSGNVALHAAEKAVANDARVVSLSDSDGFVYAKNGFDADHVAAAKDIKLDERGRIAELAERCSGIEFHAGESPWSLAVDIAMPCATQNELDEQAAKTLIDNGVAAVCEGANMPCTAQASTLFRREGVLFAPGKAANAGGVAVSGLEISQNAQRLSWEWDEVDQRLRDIMADIHATCVEHGQDGKRMDYVDGANRAAFERVAHALLSFGAI